MSQAQPGSFCTCAVCLGLLDFLVRSKQNCQVWNRQGAIVWTKKLLFGPAKQGGLSQPQKVSTNGITLPKQHNTFLSLPTRKRVQCEASLKLMGSIFGLNVVLIKSCLKAYSDSTFISLFTLMYWHFHMTAFNFL